MEAALSRSDIAEELGIPADHIKVEEGDTDTAPYGLGTYASRSTPTAGAAASIASRKVREKAKKIAAHLLEASADDLETDYAKEAFGARVGGLFGPVQTESGWNVGLVERELPAEAAEASARMLTEVRIGDPARVLGRRGRRQRPRHPRSAPRRPRRGGGGHHHAGPGSL